MLRAILLALLATLTGLAGTALSAPFGDQPTKLSVRLGFGNRYVTGRWTPVFVTASDVQNRPVTIEVESPQSGSYVMQIRQPAVIGPIPQTAVLYVPLASYGYGLLPTVSLRDSSGSTLTTWSYREIDDAFQPQQVPYNHWMIGVTGRQTALPGLIAELGGKATAAYLPADELPENAIGYDMLHLLVLYRADLTRMGTARQQAIVDWVRRGGVAVVIPGDEGTPAGSPLGSVLPATVGAASTIEAAIAGAATGGEVNRPASLSRFELIPKPDAQVVPFPLDTGKPGDARAYSRRLGFGRLIVLPADLVLLSPALPAAKPDEDDDASKSNDNSPDPDRPAVTPANPANPADRQAARPWSQLLQHTNLFDGVNRPSPVDERQQMAISTSQDYLADVPSAARFGFAYIGWGVLALMLLVGPVDWFVLKALRRQPWTWVTLFGWIGLLTGAALMVGQWFRAGDLHVRSIQVVDQADGLLVGRSAQVMIYSPRSAEYAMRRPLSPGESEAPDAPPDPPAGWWQPASAGGTDSSKLQTDMAFRPADNGLTPEPIRIGLWTLRLMSAEVVERSPGWLAGELAWAESADGWRLTGTLRNTSPYALTDVRIDTRRGFAAAAAAAAAAPATRAATPSADDDNAAVMVTESQATRRWLAAPVAVPRIGPGETVKIDLPVRTPAGSRRSHLSESAITRRYRTTEAPSAEYARAGAPDLSAHRTARVAAELQASDAVVVHAVATDAPPPATVSNPDARHRHDTVLRALLPVGGAAK